MSKSIARLLAALALLFAHAAWAQAAKSADPALWVVEDEDTAIYLFGTVHVLRPGMEWFDGAVWAAFNQSDTLVMELADPAGPATLAAIMRMGMTTSGPPLSEKLSPAQRAIFAPAVAKLGLPAAILERQKPWMASVTLSVLPLIKAGYNPASGPEMMLLAAARKAKKPVEGLETPEEQLAQFDRMPEPKQIDGLVESLAQLDKIVSTTDAMVESWARGDAPAIARYIAEAPGSSPEMVRFLLSDRNARWAEWIEKRMERPGKLFVAVGAGHLAGRQSVQAYLARHGLRAKRIRY